MLEGKEMQNFKYLTYTGKYIDIFDMTPDNICLEDIAHALATKTRFGGAARIPYSIAQHCCLAACWANPPLDRRIAFLHDGEEAYMPDFPGPWRQHPMMKEWNTFGDRLRDMIWTKYVPGWTEGMTDYRYVDNQLCVAEIRILVHNWQNTHTGNQLLDLPIEIEPWSWQEAERQYLNFCSILGIKD